MHTMLWQKILNDVSQSIDAHRFETWFKPLSASPKTTSSCLKITAPNMFIRDFLDQHYKKTLLSIAQNYSNGIQNIIFDVENGTGATHAVVAESPRNEKITQVKPQTPGFIYPVLNTRYSFDSFVVGSGNEFAKSAAFAVAEAPGKTKFNPLLIYGGVGLGKTHLLQSIGNYVLSLSDSYRVIYITSEEFYLNFIDAIKNNSTKSFTGNLRSMDILLMDDIQFLSGKESTQEEFFYIFNTLYQNGKQIVLTSDVPPNTLKGLQDRLISRFQWGLSVDIQPPDLETRVAILKKKAEDDNLNLPDDVLYFIAENVSSNIRELEGIVIRLLAFASITKSDITIGLVQTLLKDSFKKGKSKITIDEIIETASDYFKVPVNNIREKNRRKEVAYCRQVAMYVTKAITNHSLKSIGLYFGGRDHSTVIHAVQQIEKLRKDDDSVSRDVNYIISALQNRV